jgi:hypothetical protein
MQVTRRNLYRLVCLTSAPVLLIAVTAASAEDMPQMQHDLNSASQERSCDASIPGSRFPGGFDSVQVETSDITRYELFFESVLHVPVVQSLDHPQVDRLRSYCYRGVLIVIRQDLRTPRPTGWVQINFSVSDVAAVQAELEGSYRASALSQLAEEERTKIVRFRLKPDVSRGHRKATRFEVTGPEGFMIGFNQYK